MTNGSWLLWLALTRWTKINDNWKDNEAFFNFIEAKRDKNGIVILPLSEESLRKVNLILGPHGKTIIKAYLAHHA